MMVKAEFINPNYYFPVEHTEKAKEFEHHYKLALDINSATAATKFVDSKKRICKFCQKKSPDVTFKNTAHLIPEFLGNRNFVHYSECDACNELFSAYENDLANFLGLDLIVNCVKGKKKKGGGRIPKFKDYTLTVEHRKESELDLIEFTNLNYQNTSFEADIENQKFKINYTKKPYVPLFVYKAFLKIALSFIPDVDMHTYKAAREFIIRKDLYPLTGFEYISYYKMPISYNYASPSIMLFKKKNQNLNVMTDFFALFIYNYMFQLPIPLSDYDLPLMLGKKQLDVKWMPAIFGTNDISDIREIYQNCLKLDSNEKKVNDNDCVKIPASREDLEYVKFKNSDGTISDEKLDLDKIKSLQVLRY